MIGGECKEEQGLGRRKTKIWRRKRDREGGIDDGVEEMSG